MIRIDSPAVLGMLDAPLSGAIMSPDAVNGLFEAAGAAFLFLNVAKLHHDKELKGIDWRAVAFFFSWGIWNLWFYPAQGLIWSFLGGILIALMNCLWLGLAGYYWFCKRSATARKPLVSVGEIAPDFVS